ncbi:cytochrome c family protein [Aestuariibius sp. HNIBRBA575]|uniref:c-type cytochrome n=1 Tax=Aestuariibius sp. HNIBRBA575 TaxID=3233343 RepID=UPI0034A358A4
MKTMILVGALLTAASNSIAESHETPLQGDIANGETLFARQCVACHVVVNDAGETLAGRSARTGPNLFGSTLRPIGTVEGYRYGSAILSLGEQGLHWDEEGFVGYIQDPTAWLRDATGDASARGKMSYKVREESDAYDIYAYLHSLDLEPES